MLIPLILSGGSGSRLWPVSREAHPKPFMNLPDGQSLLQKTFLRAASLPGVGEILTITNREYYFKTREDYGIAAGSSSADVNRHFLLEPFGRNTAPAVALGALKVQRDHGSDAIMLVLAADHLIGNPAAFAACVKEAEAVAANDLLVTFGIVPSTPETGYGYIECGEPLGDAGGRSVRRFVEKPSLAVAESYVASGDYLWNSGMFAFKAGVILEELRLHAPELMTQVEQCWAATTAVEAGLADVIEIDAKTFRSAPDISIDYAVMERSQRVAVIKSDIGWSDIGSWNAIGALTPPDASGNRVIGQAVLVDTENSFVQSETRLVATVGVKNLVIVDTPDAVLVADRDRAQDVKKVVQQLKLAEHEAYKLHRTVSRPWGTYTVLEEGTGFKIKRIVVKPRASLSLQMHHHRSEHWVVVSGTAKVVNGERELLVRKNESTYIPSGHRHRLENPGVMDLIMIEVQSGDYLGEDDIVRFEDKYGRT